MLPVAAEEKPFLVELAELGVWGNTMNAGLTDIAARLLRSK
jgi:hypothetical protein